jgi:hypothetical protein
MPTLLRTNYHEREWLSWWDLSDSERAELEWADPDGSFLRYRGVAYSICQFESRQFSELPGKRGGYFSEPIEWVGIHCDSFFSGVVLGISRDGETYIAGTIISVSDLYEPRKGERIYGS